MSILPDIDRFRFVYAKYGSGHMSEVCHFVTQEVATAKSVQTAPCLKNTKPMQIWGVPPERTLKK